MLTEQPSYNEVLVQENTSFKLKQYIALLKVRLSGLVVFSGVFGFLLASQGEVAWLKLIALIIGSFIITGSANIINQVLEKDLDKNMRRTQNRPLPTGTVSTMEAIILAISLAIIGAVILAVFVNPLTTVLSILSLLLYAFAYTPLKQISPLSVLVGAFPGALPPLIGWAAMTGEVTIEAMIIFGIQFIWQFPHFWAIAWVGDNDYKKAGFKMLPFNGKKDFNTTMQIMIYTLFLIPLGIMPFQYGMTGVISAVIATLAGVFFLVKALVLMWTGTDKAALHILFTSFFYLPIVQIAFLLDKV